MVRRLALAALAVGCLAGPALAAAPNLAKLILRPAQLGAGYRLVQRADGHGVKNTVTLDLCGFVFQSEGLRASRLQVNYVRKPTDVTFSNEVVVYKSGEAPEALAEARYAQQHCPTKPIKSPYLGGPPVRWRLTALKDPALAAGYVAFRLDAGVQRNGKLVHEISVAVYQIRGDVLSAVYAYPGKGTSEAELRKAAFRAAEAAAANLGPVRVTAGAPRA